MNNIMQVVSVATAQKRREHIQTHFSALQVEFDFFDAITPSEVSSVVSKNSLTFMQDNLTATERACFLSHYLLWQKLANSQHEYMIICEDDVVLSSCIHQLLDELPNIIKSYDVSILKFETVKRLVLLSSDCVEYTHFKLHKLISEHTGTGGYVISKSMACYFMDLLKNKPIDKPIDNYIFDEKLLKIKNIYQTVPAFLIQDCVLNQDNMTFNSDLQIERQRRQNLAGRKYENKLVREFMRLFRYFSADYRAEKSFKKYLEKNGQIIEFKE